MDYEVTYTDMYSNYDFNSTNGWRVLNPNSKDNSGKAVVDIISTGIPVKLSYNNATIKSAGWASSVDRSAYTSKFYSSFSDDNENMYAAAGMYFNLRNIPFAVTDNMEENSGAFVKINGNINKTNGTEFIRGNAIDAHPLTLTELNMARNKKAGSDVFALDQIQGESSYYALTTENDAATGLFFLKDLNKFNYPGTSAYYWLASPNAGNPTSVGYVGAEGEIHSTDGDVGGLRIVVSIPVDKFNLNKVEQ